MRVIICVNESLRPVPGIWPKNNNCAKNVSIPYKSSSKPRSLKDIVTKSG
jgi:hypothetical protein